WPPTNALLHSFGPRSWRRGTCQRRALTNSRPKGCSHPHKFSAIATGIINNWHPAADGRQGRAKRPMGTLKTVINLAILAYAGVLALMYVFQRALMYFPDPARTPPAAAGLPQAEEVTLTSADGEKLIAWYVPARAAKPLVIYFQGNAGALNLRAERFKWVIGDGTGLLALSYRGYGGSTGKPSEIGLITDAAAAYDFAAARYPAKRIVVWGESLGTAVAVAVAADHEVSGVILDAPFTSIADVGAAAYPFAPVR